MVMITAQLGKPGQIGVKEKLGTLPGKSFSSRKARLTARSPYGEQRVGRSRRSERRRVIYITTSGPKRRYEYVSSSVHVDRGLWRSLRGLSTRTLWRRWRRNILFASILASQWSWVTLLLTQDHSGSLRISDPTGQDQSWKQHFIQGWLGSLRITPIRWVGSWHWKTVGWSQIWDMEPTSTLTTPEKRPVGSFIS